MSWGQANKFHSMPPPRATSEVAKGGSSVRPIPYGQGGSPGAAAHAAHGPEHRFLITINCLDFRGWEIQLSFLIFQTQKSNKNICFKTKNQKENQKKP